MLPKAIVFFDLDGTLYNSNHQIEPSSLQAIHQLQKNNILAVIATGRARSEISDILKMTNINSYITNNGASITLNDQIIYHNYIKPTLCKKVVQLARQLNDTVGFYNDNQEAIDHATSLSLARHRYLGHVDQIDAHFYKKYPVQLLLIIADEKENHDYIYQKKFQNDLKMYRTSSFTIDVINKTCSKKEGIQRLLNKLSFNTSIPTYAFGDSNNDIEMFKLVQHPIAMGNALPFVKKNAEYITSDHDDDGIANGLKHFNLI